jgi:predicted P-loop ATPase
MKNNNEKDNNEPSIYDTMAKYLIDKYKIRYNLIRQIPEIMVDGKYHELASHLYNNVFLELREQGIKIGETDIQKVLASDKVPVLNPLKYFFSNLPVWDKKDHIKALADSVQLCNNDPEIQTDELNTLWKSCLTKWLVGLLSGVLNQDPSQFVFVLTGEQGAGKTTWLRNLCPPPLMEDYYFEGYLTPRANNKDTIDILTEKLIVNFDDQIDNLSPRDFGNLKAVISAIRLTSKKNYAINNNTRYKTCGFVASTNNPEFLVDDKNRRYLVFTVKQIQQFPNIDINQVYAQAHYLMTEGLSHHLDKAEQQAIHKMNLRYRDVSIEEELIMSYFKPIEKAGDDEEWHSSTEILIYLQNQTGNKSLSKTKIGAALKALNFEHRTKRTGLNTPKKWGVVKIKGPAFS